MTNIKIALVAALALGATVAVADAQTAQTKQPPRPILIDPYNRGPPRQPDRPWPPPKSEVAPPRELTPPVAPLAPRVGN